MKQMKQTRGRTNTGPIEFQGKSELQRKLQSMVVACRDNSLKNSSESNKLSNTELRLKRAEAQSQMNFAKTSPAAISIEPTPPLSRKTSNLDPLQNCYGRSINTNVNGPKGILTKPSTPKVSKGKRVTFSLDLETDIPSRSDSPNPLETTTNNSNTISPTATASNNNILASSSNNNLPSVDFKTAQQQNILKKSNLFQAPATPKATRPSLSEQLSAIANKAGDITAEIKTKAGLNDSSSGSNEQPLLTSPAKNFTVGNLQCRYPAPAVFYRDRLEYTFHHPFQSAEIHLILYYRDMQGLTLSPNPQPGKIHFRVPRKLVHFASDYDPTKHYVTLYLSSSLALENIRNEILPLVPGRNSSIGSTLAKLT